MVSLFLQLKLDKLLNSSLETSENLLFLLDSCPDSKIDLTMSPVSGQLSDLSKCCKQDSSYVSLKNDIEVGSMLMLIVSYCSET